MTIKIKNNKNHCFHYAAHISSVCLPQMGGGSCFLVLESEGFGTSNLTQDPALVRQELCRWAVSLAHDSCFEQIQNFFLLQKVLWDSTEMVGELRKPGQCNTLCHLLSGYSRPKRAPAAQPTTHCHWYLCSRKNDMRRGPFLKKSFAPPSSTICFYVPAPIWLHFLRGRASSFVSIVDSSICALKSTF